MRFLIFFLLPSLLFAATPIKDLKATGAPDFSAATNKSTILSDLGAAASAFTQTGTGAVPTTIDAEIRKQALTPRQYGAVGDGSTDDTVAFGKLFVAAKAQNKPIWITGGTAGFLLPNGLLAIDWKAVIFGDGPSITCPSRILVTNATAHGLQVRTDLLTSSLYEVVVRDFCIIGPSSATAKGVGVFVNPYRALTITSISIANPCVITTDLALSTAGISNGSAVTIGNIINAPTLSGDYLAVVTGANTLTLTTTDISHTPVENTNATISGIISLTANATQFVDKVQFKDVTIYGFKYGIAGYHWSNSEVSHVEVQLSYNGGAFGGNCNNLDIHGCNFGASNVCLIGWGSGAGLKISPFEAGGAGTKKFAVFGGGFGGVIENGNVEAIQGGSAYGASVWMEAFNGCGPTVKDVQFLGSDAIPALRCNAYSQGWYENIAMNNAPGGTRLAQVDRRCGGLVTILDKYSAYGTGTRLVDYFDDSGAFATPFATTVPLGMPFYHSSDHPTPAATNAGTKFMSLDPSGTAGSHVPYYVAATDNGAGSLTYSLESLVLTKTANTFSKTQTLTLAPVFTDQSGSRTALGAAATSGTLAQFASTTSTQLRGIISDPTGTGALVFGTSPSFTTPILGTATATYLNNLSIINNGSFATLDIAAGKKLTASNIITLSGADNVAINLGATNGTLGSAAFTASTAYQTARAELSLLGLKGADIAAGATIDLSTATGDFVDITGTNPTATTSMGTATAGTERAIRNQVSGTFTLTHNATSLILPGGTNVLPSTNDVLKFRSLGSGNWICISWYRANGNVTIPTATGQINFATNSSGSTPKMVFPLQPGTNVVFQTDNYANGEFYIGYPTTSPRFYMDMANNRTSIGHTANSGPSGTKTLNVEGTLDVTGDITLSKTITAAGTTAAQTINKSSGVVNIASTESTKVVTNNLVTANSIVTVQVEGTDATATSARVTKASGSFTITLNAAAAAETAVSFRVTN